MTAVMTPTIEAPNPLFNDVRMGFDALNSTFGPTGSGNVARLRNVMGVITADFATGPIDWNAPASSTPNTSLSVAQSSDIAELTPAGGFDPDATMVFPHLDAALRPVNQVTFGEEGDYDEAYGVTNEGEEPVADLADLAAGQEQIVSGATPEPELVAAFETTEPGRTRQFMNRAKEYLFTHRTRVAASVGVIAAGAVMSNHMMRASGAHGLEMPASGMLGAVAATTAGTDGPITHGRHRGTRARHASPWLQLQQEPIARTTQTTVGVEAALPEVVEATPPPPTPIVEAITPDVTGSTPVAAEAKFEFDERHIFAADFSTYSYKRPLREKLVPAVSMTAIGGFLAYVTAKGYHNHELSLTGKVAGSADVLLGTTLAIARVRSVGARVLNALKA